MSHVFVATSSSCREPSTVCRGSCYDTRVVLVYCTYLNNHAIILAVHVNR
jgi:hypothetical protein